jgi:hypothetical protein
LYRGLILDHENRPFLFDVTLQFALDDTVQPGDALVSNFNNGANLQGTGTTIINIRPDRTSALFAGKLTPGLTAALSILRAGFVLVGSISTTDGTFATVKTGPNYGP